MEFFDTLRQVNSNWGRYKKWELEQQKKEKQNEQLRKQYPPTPEDLKKANLYGRTIIDAINTMDQHSIDKSEDASTIVGYNLLGLSMGSITVGLGGGALIRHLVGDKMPNMKPYWQLISVIVVESIAMTFGSIWQSKVAKQASRIARFQTRENDLKDPKNFVIYDENQIDKAKDIAKTLPEVKEHQKPKNSDFNPYRNFVEAKKTTDELKKEEAEYFKWKDAYQKAENEQAEKLKKLNPSKEDLSKAEKEKEVLLNTIKKIEASSLNYVNNVEMATSVVSSIVTSAGLVAGLGLSKLVDILPQNKIIPKASKQSQFLKGFLVIFAPAIGPLILLSPMNKALKDAARIGRFKTKQELLSNPQNFIAYDSEQRGNLEDKNTSDIEKQPKGFWARFKHDLSELKQLKKDYLEYQQYMKTTHKDELKLREALKKIETSEEQNKNSLQLQKKVFHSFEKVDEKAQRFTDDTEAAVDSAKLISISILSIVTKLIPVFVCGQEVKRANGGKMPEKLREVLKLTFSGKLRGRALAVMLVPFVVPKFVKPLIMIKGIQIKKDAGKIGVMTAMNDMDDPKKFLDS